ncbi:hypothetical protein R1sor_005948 [Riccia sorocarpa]|uniref:Uncharacterized protein n=1 Tax=Riccia sorocarpa TaxID=122646 RepID=A0ABD3HL98_9MARC
MTRSLRQAGVQIESKKGPWSQEEDGKLKAFIDQHGTGGNWITLPSKAGLKRCGKSCRLRWINYLRPDIKHGNFTEEEETTIYQLHSQIGSRWSLIAARLPGRTDNDIKNYWNTRLKKKLLDSGSVLGFWQLHPYPMPGDIYGRLGLQDQRLRFEDRESLLHGQYPSYYNIYQQQQPYLPGTEQQHPVRTIEHNAHQLRQFSAGFSNINEAERQRLSIIESSLMSMISTGETTVSDSSSDGSFSNQVSSIN